MPRPRRDDYICGTYEAYQAHVRRGEKTDADCVKANREYNSNRRQGKRAREAAMAADAAEQRAHDRLAEEHPHRFLELLLEETVRPNEGIGQ